MKRRNKNDPILFDLTVTQDNVNSSLKEVARDFIAKPIGKPPVFPDKKQKRCILSHIYCPYSQGKVTGNHSNIFLDLDKKTPITLKRKEKATGTNY